MSDTPSAPTSTTHEQVIDRFAVMLSEYDTEMAGERDKASAATTPQAPDPDENKLTDFKPNFKEWCDIQSDWRRLDGKLRKLYGRGKEHRIMALASKEELQTEATALKARIAALVKKVGGGEGSNNFDRFTAWIKSDLQELEAKIVQDLKQCEEQKEKEKGKIKQDKDKGGDNETKSSAASTSSTPVSSKTANSTGTNNTSSKKTDKRGPFTATKARGAFTATPTTKGSKKSNISSTTPSSGANSSSASGSNTATSGKSSTTTSGGSANSSTTTTPTAAPPKAASPGSKSTKSKKKKKN